MSLRILNLVGLSALLMWTGASWAYPSESQVQIAKSGDYVGSQACAGCHSATHAEWKNTWHTLKATKGPAFGKEFDKNIYEWVRRDWDKLDTYMIVDRKDGNTVYVAVEKVPLSKVDYVVGQVRKQRYATYYDGGPLNVWEAKTEDGGISWKLDKSQTARFDGNKDRAGYKFLFIEVNPQDGKMNKNNYGEFYSWQERCIACHTTGFDYKKWESAKADFKAGKRKDLREVFVADLAVSCESCHGPGSAHVKSPTKATIINPAKIDDVEARKMVCEQCHTRTQASVLGKGANDLRGYRLMERYEDYATYTRPAWGKGNRQVSIDGKGRRDHQQDMDMRLSTTIKGEGSAHAKMACFDCHDAHRVGLNKSNPRLKKSQVETCASCHGDKAKDLLKALDGAQGWEKAGYGNWGTAFGRTANKQHLFNLDSQGRTYGIKPEQYTWALKKDGDPKKEADWMAVWPWEQKSMAAKGLKTATGATPWQ